MIAVLRVKPDGAGLTVVEGDMTSTDMGGKYGLIYLVFNRRSSTCNTFTSAQMAGGWRRYGCVWQRRESST